jgi:hypothetical protein
MRRVSGRQRIFESSHPQDQSHHWFPRSATTPLTLAARLRSAKSPKVVFSLNERPSQLDEISVVPDGRGNVEANFSGEEETRRGSELPFLSGPKGRAGGHGIPAVRERLRSPRWRRVK